MTPFDLNLISDAETRTVYRLALQRAEDTARLAGQHYGPDKPSIECRYVQDDSFNAWAHKRGHYEVMVSSAVPLLAQIYFTRLLSEDTVLPYLSSTEPPVSTFEVQAIVDPLDFNHRELWQVRLTRERAFAASVFTDIVCAFVFFHEIGHVLCGHVDAHILQGHEQPLAELLRFKLGKAEKRRQAWEVDADTVSASLLMSHVRELLHQYDEDERLHGLVAHSDYPLEHFLALHAAALFVFFCYVMGVRSELNRYTTHPHPLVRSIFLRDVIATAAKSYWLVDTELMEDIYYQRLSEFIATMQAKDLLKVDVLDDVMSEQVRHQVDALHGMTDKYRRQCAPWSWITWG